MHNEHSGATVDILPELGAQVNSIILPVDGQLLSVLDGCESKKELSDNPAFRSALLAPFPNRINKGHYQFMEENYQLEINFPAQGHAIHGFLYTLPFVRQSLKLDENHIAFELLLDYPGNVQGYPFPFLFGITYLLNEQGLSCQTTMKNTGNRSMPVGIGWHPYFSFPETVIDNLSLQLPTCSELEVDDAMIPTGSTKICSDFADFRVIGEKEFDTGYYLHENNKRQVTKIRSEVQNAELQIWQENYPYLQVYTPPGRQSIAIEPMTCATDVFNNGMGQMVLQPGDSFSGQFGVSLMPLT
ncbi:MAG: hypothetical protein AAF502_13520 [Bacteroidota bacterium]